MQECDAARCSPHRRRNRRRCGDKAGFGRCCIMARAHDRAPAPPRAALAGSLAPPRKPATCATYRSACGHRGADGRKQK